MSTSVPAFRKTLADRRVGWGRAPLETLQINLGKRCNQACHHCHVDAGPLRTEQMDTATLNRLLELLAASPGVGTVDVTGGAPELHPEFRRLVREARAMGKAVIDRCNLTVLQEAGQVDTAAFLAAHQVRIVASLPCYTSDNVDRQRGKGVFARSVAALRELNALGYGVEGTGLVLDLVYNPGGATLPGPQAGLEGDYKRRLAAEHGISFNHLLTLTNMPISRFLWDLERSGKLEVYLELLVQAFNPVAAEAVMCRSLVSVGWDGRLYDCDFNQMLELPVPGAARNIWDLSSFEALDGADIQVDTHCYGCTAGAGSSCGGALS